MSLHRHGLELVQLLYYATGGLAKPTNTISVGSPIRGRWQLRHLLFILPWDTLVTGRIKASTVDGAASVRWLPLTTDYLITIQNE